MSLIFGYNLVATNAFAVIPIINHHSFWSNQYIPLLGFFSSWVGVRDKNKVWSWWSFFPFLTMSAFLIIDEFQLGFICFMLMITWLMSEKDLCGCFCMKWIIFSLFWKNYWCFVMVLMNSWFIHVYCTVYYGIDEQTR